LLIFAAVIQERSAEFDHLGKDLVHRPSSQSRVVVEMPNELASQGPHVADMFLDRIGRQIRRCQVLQKRTEQPQELLPWRQVFLHAHPRAWPTVQIPAVVFEFMAPCGGGAVYLGSLRNPALRAALGRCPVFLSGLASIPITAVHRSGRENISLQISAQDLDPWLTECFRSVTVESLSKSRERTSNRSRK
jgi:hypothetical protein